jgi:2,3-bisphosphoglycerate-dependent phosphoglycerate mutase
MTTRLLIVRHGNTFGPNDIVTRVGSTDLPLVDSGLRQGRMLGQYLKSAGLIPDAIFTSKLKRTMQTAEQAQAEMGTSLPLSPLTIFNEIDYGPDENKPEQLVVARLGEPALEAWDSEGIVPNGWKVDPAAIVRNWQDFAATVLRDYSGKTVMVVTSNGIARFAPHITGDFKAFRANNSIKISTGALCVFENKGKGWICEAWNLKPKELLAVA